MTHFKVVTEDGWLTVCKNHSFEESLFCSF